MKTKAVAASFLLCLLVLAAFPLASQLLTEETVTPDVLPELELPPDDDVGAVVGLPTMILSQNVFSVPTLIDSPSASFKVKYPE